MQANKSLGRLWTSIFTVVASNPEPASVYSECDKNVFTVPSQHQHVMNEVSDDETRI